MKPVPRTTGSITVWHVNSAWTWQINLFAGGGGCYACITPNNAYKSEGFARAAARRVVKRLNIEVEE